ncbi:MAG: uracil-DNA glycosylase family protein [Bacteroidales bacterium]|nr:uracil-DNA glycosylase family protein [Bacteroidales bacterium]
MSNPSIEELPFPPFLPNKAKWLFLGSFPPKKHRWSMDFFYPNFQNDMWRIFGLIFFENKNHFVNTNEKCFEKAAIETFLMKQRIAMYDTAAAVIRHKDNASDKDLEIVKAVDIGKLIQKLPDLQAIVTTGQKACEAVIQHFAEKNVNIAPPEVGTYTSFVFENRTLQLYRMPSSSRAYPLSLEKKAEIYSKIFYT